MLEKLFSQSKRFVKKHWKVLGYPAWLGTVFVLAQLIVVFFYKIGIWLHIDITSNETVKNTLLTLIIYLLSIALVLVIPAVIRKKHTSWRELGWSRLPYWRDILLAIVAMIIYYILSGLLILAATHIIPGFNINQTQDVGYDHLNGQFEYLLAFVTLVILAPFAEETLFRGYLYGKLRRNASIVTSVLVTSLLFGVLHGAWNVGIDVFAMSVVSCILREKTGSLWSSFLLHMTKNGIAYFFLFIYPLISVTLGA